NHLPLIQALQQSNPTTSTRDLVKLDRAAWLNLLNQQVNGKPVGMPPGVSGATPPEQATNYVNGIVSTLQAAFPTDAVAQIAAKAQSLPTLQSVTKFFANSPDFSL